MRFLLVFIYFLLITFFTGTKGYRKNNWIMSVASIEINKPIRDTILESKIFDTLIKLSFIKRDNNHIDSITRHKHGIAFLIDPVSKSEDVIVHAGFNGKYRFETHYLIYVNPKTLDIKIYDPVTDEKLSVKEFEKKEVNFKKRKGK